jgi:hypothetical protein
VRYIISVPARPTPFGPLMSLPIDVARLAVDVEARRKKLRTWIKKLTRMR